MTLIATVLGARPQFIKAAMVSRILREDPQVQEIIIHTGQHYDANMSVIFFQEMEIPEPTFNLGIGNASHGAMTGRMLEKIEEILLRECPDLVLVYGDTNSTLAGALAAAKLNLPVAHVEAGLRSFNRRMPEEINRVLTDHLAKFLFAPTEAAVANLRQEGISGDLIYLVGDVMYDAALYYGAKAERESRVLKQLGLCSRRYILATVHRAENTDSGERLRAIFSGLSHIARDIPIVVPLHPRTRAALKREGVEADGMHLMEPVGYLDMVMLEKQARLIATDSGGVQKEAFFYRVPCVTLREETEWVELVELGWNRVISPSSTEAVTQGVYASLRAPSGKDGRPYGDGRAAKKIVDILPLISH
jgi:UDP-GlcNAc3NAcA epimerase